MNFFNYQKRGAANCGFLQQLQDFKTNRTSTLTASLLRVGWRGKKLPPLGGNNAPQPYRSVYYVQIGAETNGNGTKESPYNNIHNIFENMDIYYAAVFQFTVVHVYVSGDPITTPILPFGYNEDGTESAEWKAKQSLFRTQIERSFLVPTYGDQTDSISGTYGYCGNLVIHNAVFSYNENSDTHYGRMIDYGRNYYYYLSYAEFPSGIVWENCNFNIIYSDVPDDMVPDAETAYARRGDDNWDETELRGFTILELSKAVKKLHELAPDIYGYPSVGSVRGIYFNNNAILLNSTFTVRLGKSGRGGRAINKTDGNRYVGQGGPAIDLEDTFKHDFNMVLLNSKLNMTFCGPGDGADGYDTQEDYVENDVTIRGKTGLDGSGVGYMGSYVDVGMYSVRNSEINIKIYNSAKGGRGGDCTFDYSHVIQSRPTDDGKGGLGGVVIPYPGIEFSAYYMTDSVLNITCDTGAATSGLAGKHAKISIYSIYDESELLESYTEPQRYYDGGLYGRSANINITYCKNSEINVNCEKIGNILDASHPCVELTGNDHYNVTLNVTYDLTYNHCRESDAVSGNDCIIPCVRLYTYQNMMDITRTDTEYVVTPGQIRNRVSQVTANIIYNNIPTALEPDVLVEYGTEQYTDNGQTKYRPMYRASRSEPSYRIIGDVDISGYVAFPNVTIENKSNLVLAGEPDEFGLRINTTKFPELTCASYRGGYDKSFDGTSDYPIGIPISGANAVYIPETGDVYDGGAASSGAKWGPITIPAGTPGAAVAQDQWSGGVCLPENITTILNFSTERIELNLI